MNKPLLYLAGYGQHNRAETLKRLVCAMEAVVVDVRLYPISRRQEWRSENLRERLGIGHYWNWGPYWGNANYRGNLPGERFQLLNWELGLRRLEEKIARAEERGQPITRVILLCGCRDEAGCHRGEIGKRLHALGYRVKSLKWQAPVERPLPLYDEGGVTLC